MNSFYLYEYSYYFEMILSIAVKLDYSTKALERMISYSKYFNGIENDLCTIPPVANEKEIIDYFFPNLNIDPKDYPLLTPSCWVSEAYLRIQGETGYTFEYIFLYIPIKEMYEKFPIYHEMDFTHIISYFYELVIKKSPLEILCERYGYSLKYVSEQTKIPYRTLISLSRRERDIKNTSVTTVLKLAKFLNVRIETLSEYKIIDLDEQRVKQLALESYYKRVNEKKDFTIEESQEMIRKISKL